MEAGEYGLTRVTRVVARRLELVAVAGLLWLSWCVLGGADFFDSFFLERTRPAVVMRPPCFLYLSSSRGYRGWVVTFFSTEAHSISKFNPTP